MQFIIIFVLVIIAIWFFQGSKGVVYMKQLNKLLKDDYGWTQSEFDIMWSNHADQLNKLKIEGMSTHQLAQHIDQYLSQYKNAFK